MIKKLLSKAAGGVSGFLASKGVTVFLLAVIAGIGGWVYYDIKQSGKIEAERDRLALVAQDNARNAQYFKGQAEKLTEINAAHRESVDALRRKTNEIDRRTQKALREASDAFRSCYDMPLPDGMRFGPGYEDADSGSAEDGAG